jgi:hypothetical protein
MKIFFKLLNNNNKKSTFSFNSTLFIRDFNILSKNQANTQSTNIKKMNDIEKGKQASAFKAIDDHVTKVNSKIIIIRS